MTLEAFFIGIIQVLVYAGAVMVLFLFIIMLLDLRAEERRRINHVAFVGGAAVATIFFLQICFVIGKLRSADSPFAPLPQARADDVHRVGLLLFSNYNLPFQVIGVLILVATIGVVVLSKRELR
jgi:NADH-quinone oxidoreductase subunit J